MMNMFKALNSNNQIILKNFSYLTLMKFFNIGVKIVLAAYLIRILGSEKYGLITWLDSVIQYFIMIVNFGFNIYAAKYIVENKNKSTKINEIVSSIFIIKGCLFIFSLICVLFLGSFETFSAYKRLLLLLMFSGIGEVLFPVWFFQGTENLKPATIIVFLTRLFLLVGTVIFVNSQYDLLSYILLFVSSSLLMGGFGIFYLFKYYNIRIVLLPINKLIHYFRESLPFFIGRFLSLVFNFGTIFFIGKFCLLEQVTGFDTGLKIVMLGVIPFEMLQQAVFPTISRTKNKKLLKNLVYVSFIVGVFIGSIIFLMADYFMVWFGGEEMLQFAPSLKLLAILSPFVSLTFILGTCSLVAFGFYREYNFSLIFTSIVYMLILIVLYFTGKINFWNLIYLRVFGDVLMALIRLFYSFKRKTIIA
ncbi:oligosaccharide flippase family protein [Polaribacter sp.]|jgi:polysaccharide transporter, PST family|uniref:oligosaccharide flippase family protein n=1 Tax=Polaribacter sp. TaxID=1920175 RepID=UPI002607BAA3|nr:oligosaccharide flippase family protein [Polaribacter sp.]MDG1404316.1 oligosaccharide flippase family protein [Polaribacter sp.]